VAVPPNIAAENAGNGDIHPLGTELLETGGNLDEVRRDQVARWRSGQFILLEEHLRGCPELTQNAEDTLVLIVGEILLRRKLGQEATLPVYQARFPHLANQLSVQFQLDRLWTDAAIQHARPIVCPVCKNEIEPLDPVADELVCPACGSSFLLEREATLAWQPGEQRRRPGKYELIESVGIGSFGTVYKARDVELDRVVAIKVPRATQLSGTEDLERFQREARSVASLRHPSIWPAGVVQFGWNGQSVRSFEFRGKRTTRISDVAARS
jgi:hypothetical protein